MKQVLQKNHRFSFGIDFDDVLAPLNDVAVELANEKYGLNLTINDITCWEHTEKTKVVKEFYALKSTLNKQVVPESAKKFIKELQKLGDVYIITAVVPELMGVRIQQIKAAFPNIPDENIIMGYAKNLVHFDVTLDDGPHNILKSTATYPVLFRKPWNRMLSGVLAVNNYDEFLTLVHQIKSAFMEEKKEMIKPTIIALVGPSGSQKNKLAKQLEKIGIGEIVSSYTTKGSIFNRPKTHLSSEKFQTWKNEGKLFSTTVYAGYDYGTSKESIDSKLSQGKNVIMPLDICGAIGLQRFYPTILIFCKQSREKMIENILSDPESDNEEKKFKLLSMEKEIENARLCDYKVCTSNIEDAAKEIFEKLLTSIENYEIDEIAKNPKNAVSVYSAGKGEESSVGALEVAKYILAECERMEKPITNSQLQVLLYFVQRDFLQIKRRPAFNEKFLAHPLWPICMDVYYYYCGYGCMPIIPIFDPSVENISLPNHYTEIVDPIIKIFLRSGDRFQPGEVSKNIGAWVKTREYGERERIKNPEIPISLIKEDN